MSNFIERLNFSERADSEKAIEVKKWDCVDHYETLCRYCADNNIDLKEVSDEEFLSAAEYMRQHGQLVKCTDSYFFWID